MLSKALALYTITQTPTFKKFQDIALQYYNGHERWEEVEILTDSGEGSGGKWSIVAKKTRDIYPTLSASKNERWVVKVTCIDAKGQKHCEEIEGKVTQNASLESLLPEI